MQTVNNQFNTAVRSHIVRVVTLVSKSIYDKRTAMVLPQAPSTFLHAVEPGHSHALTQARTQHQLSTLQVKGLDRGKWVESVCMGGWSLAMSYESL